MVMYLQIKVRKKMAQNFLLSLSIISFLELWNYSKVEWESKFFYSNPSFSQFKASLDAEMKRLRSKGKGS